jgi:hypothetical protein
VNHITPNVVHMHKKERPWFSFRFLMACTHCWTCGVCKCEEIYCQMCMPPNTCYYCKVQHCDGCSWLCVYCTNAICTMCYKPCPKCHRNQCASCVTARKTELCYKCVPEKPAISILIDDCLGPNLQLPQFWEKIGPLPR